MGVRIVNQQVKTPGIFSKQKRGFIKNVASFFMIRLFFCQINTNQFFIVSDENMFVCKCRM